MVTKTKNDIDAMISKLEAAGFDTPIIDTVSWTVSAWGGPLHGSLRWTETSLETAVSRAESAAQAAPNCKITIKPDMQLTVEADDNYRDQFSGVAEEID